MAGVLENIEASTLGEIKYDLERSLQKDTQGRIVTLASANAVKGIKT